MSHSSEEASPKPTEAEGLSAVLGRNTVFSYLGRFWDLTVALLLTPYVYHKLGDDLFGVWALLATLTGYTALVDLATGPAVTKYIAEAKARDDAPGVQRLVSTGLAVQGGLAVVIIGAAGLWADRALTWVQVSPAAHAEARTALLICVAVAGGARLFSVFNCVLEGVQRLDLTNGLRMVFGAAQAAGTLLVLHLGFGIVGLAYVSVAVWVVRGASLVALARRNFPGLRPSLGSLSRGAVGQLAGFTLKVQAANISWLSMVNTDRLIVGAVLGPPKVALYELGRRLVMGVHSGTAPIIAPLIPAASHLGAQEDAARLEHLFLRASRYVALLAAAGMGFLVAVGPQALRVWLGEVRAETLAVLNVLAVGYLANMLTGPATGVGYGLGRPEFAMWRGFLLVVVQIGLGLLLVRPLGVPGPAAATTIALVCSSILYVSLVSRRCLGLTSLASSLRAWLGPLVAGAVPAVVVFCLVQALERTGAFAGRGGAVGLVGVGFAAFLMLWGVIALGLGLVTREDRQLIRAALGHIAAPRRATELSASARGS
ncbi:MAG: lipopolysaccharide biosynthesis protein [Armatimonadota bacterium]